MTEQSKGKIALIAGNGDLPLELAGQLARTNAPFVVFGIEGEALEQLKNFPYEPLSWGKVGRLFRQFKKHDIDEVVLAGGVVRRPEFLKTWVDFGTLMTLPSILGSMLAGDNTILTSVMTVFEKRGYIVRGIAEIAPQLLATEGEFLGRKTGKREQNQIDEGIAVLDALSPHDVGQACVAVGKRIVAVEGVEGTDGMLSRIAELRSQGRLPESSGGTLIKMLKQGQDERADLPTIGPDTLENAAKAGLSAIAVETGKCIVLHKSQVMELAKQHSINVIGCARKELAK